MREALAAVLKPVRRRQQSVFLLKCVLIGVGASAVAGVALGVVRLGLATELPAALAIGVLAVGPLAGLLAGLAWRKSTHGAAAAIDTHYTFKDRTVTALAFAGEATPSELQGLQYAEAMEQLRAVEPKRVVPLTAPKAWPVAVAGMAAAVALVVWPLAPKEVEAGPAPTPDHIATVIDEQATKWAERRKDLAESLNDVEDQKAEDDKKALKDLIEKKDKKLEELAQPNVNEREVLAKLAEMSAQNTQMLDQLNIAALDGQLGALGTALASSQPFEAAGKALMKGDWDKAAKEFEKLDELKLTPKESKDLEQKLKEQQKKMADAGQGSLSDAVGELADALTGGNGKGKVAQAGKRVAKNINNAIRRKKAANLLQNDEDDLKDGKCDCQNNGGERKKSPQKSNSPSSNWGRGISGNTEGERTKLNGKRNELQLTGAPGDTGDSDVETLTTPEARQQAGRAYREKFAKGKKESEAVLESEPIPLGHRQTVKRYFEMIRPSADDTFKKADDAKAAEAKPAEKK